MSLNGKTQFVETILVFPTGADGMCVDQAGNLYSASGGLSGYTVGQFNLELNAFESDFIIGLVGPTDVDFMNDSILIITNYDIDKMSAFNFNTMELVTIAEGLDGPAGIAIDDDDNIFVTNWGNAPEYHGHTITKISASGGSWTYIDSSALNRPQAIAFNHESTLIAHSDGYLYKIQDSDSTLHLWTTLGVGVGNMVFREKDSCLYAGGGHRILKIDTSGAVSTFAGSTSGYNDGDLDEALFDTPLGITFSPGEDTLYISEAGAVRRLRRIIMNGFVEVNSEETNNSDLKMYPNPLEMGDELHIESPSKEVDYIALYSTEGHLLYTHLSSNSSGNVTIPASIFSDKPSGTYIVVIVNQNGDEKHQCLIIR